MDVQSTSEWLASCPASARLRVLALIYSRLTIHTRQLFVGEKSENKDRIIDILKGLNEIHHTISNCVVDYASGRGQGCSVEVLTRQLSDIEQQYGLKHFVTPAVEHIRTWYERSGETRPV